MHSPWCGESLSEVCWPPNSFSTHRCHSSLVCITKTKSYSKPHILWKTHEGLARNCARSKVFLRGHLDGTLFLILGLLGGFRLFILEIMGYQEPPWPDTAKPPSYQSTSLLIPYWEHPSSKSSFSSGKLFSFWDFSSPGHYSSALPVLN